MARDKSSVTTPDLVILSLLAERPMHGYEVNAELERRQARDWVAISRPQIYYSLEKLVRQGLLAESADTGVVLGADRRVLRTSAKGRTVLARELERDSWTNQRERPAFLTWLALSWQASPLPEKQQIQWRLKCRKVELVRGERSPEAVRHGYRHEYDDAARILK